MNIKVTCHDNDEDLLSNLATMEDLANLMAKRVVAKIKDYPMEFAKEMKECGAIDDLQYKEMMINIREADLEKDFENNDKENG